MCHSCRKLQVSAYLVNIQTQTLPPFPIIPECLGWIKCMKTYNNLTKSTQIHKHEQTIKPHNLHTFSTHLSKNSRLIGNSRFIINVLKY